MQPLLEVRNLNKCYYRGFWRKECTFSLEADFSVAAPAIIGVMGPNGSGKTTLFELITGSNTPTSGQVLCQGIDIHRVRTGQRDRLAIHYHQSYQVRKFERRIPDFLLNKTASRYPLVHLFDEPQFSLQDGYIGFMLEFFGKLRSTGHVVFVCLHPNEPYHIELLHEICERFIYIERGSLTHASHLSELAVLDRFRSYLGHTVRKLDELLTAER